MPLRLRPRQAIVLLTALVVSAGCDDKSNTTRPVSMNDTAGADMNFWTDLSSASSITVAIDSSSLAPGHTAKATALAKSKFGLSVRKTPTWASSNTSVATISSDGTITAKAAGSTTIRATVDGVSGTAPLTVTGASTAAATALAIQTQPAGATSGAALTTQPVVRTVDAKNNVVTSAVAAVTASIASGSGKLSGTTTVYSKNGVASFTDLVVTGTGATTLRFSATSLTAAVSNSFTVAAASTTPAAATQLAVVVQPSTSATSGVALAQQPTVQLRDASSKAVSKSGVVVTAAIASGSGSLGGTLTASTNASGVATFSNLAITGSGAYTLRFTATGLTAATSSSINVTAASSGGSTGGSTGGGSTGGSTGGGSTGGSTGGGSTGGSTGGSGTADIMNNASFESGWDQFTNWTGGGTPSGVTRDNSTAADGSWSIKRSWSPSSSDLGSQLLSATGSNDHLWVRFSFKLTAPITTVMKFVRFYDPQFNTNLGGFFLGSGSNIVTFGTDRENGSITTSIGLTESQVIDGRWHTLEIDYWRNGDPSGYPSAAFYFDGNQVSQPDGTSKVQYAGSGNSSYWKGGRLYTGTRSSSVKMGYIEWLATLNGGNSTTGQVYLDRVSISTKGRIGQ